MTDTVVADLADALPSELADRRALLSETLTAPGATSLTVLAVVQREFLAG